MFCVRNIPRTCISSSVRFTSKAKYSRRSDRNTSSYKVVRSNKNDNFDEFDNTFLGINPNWEFFTPRGFRFYLPGSIGPGWLDSSTTAQVEVHSMLMPNEIEDFQLSKNTKNRNKEIISCTDVFSVLNCTAQECPTLLRKGILELFPNCLEVTSPQLTIITISQKTSKKSRWSKEIETEKLAQYFVLAASDICRKLKLCGYWADFINPFSGQPYLNPHKSGSLYETDERFRCIGFTVEQQKNCKIITNDNSTKDFIGNLFTTAPSNTEFLKEIMQALNDNSHET